MRIARPTGLIRVPAPHRRATRRTAVTLSAAVTAAVAVTFPAAAFAANGSSGNGTLTVTPTTAVAGTTSLQPVFTFAVPNGSSFAAGSELDITVPSGWTAPTTTAGTAGYTTATASGTGCTVGTVGISQTMVITVPMGTCGAGSSLTINYGTGTSTTHITPPTTAASYTFTATSKDGSNAALALSTPPAISVTPAAASKLSFTTQPGGGSAGTAWATQPVVTVQDAHNNTVTTSAASITLALTGTSGAVLSCTTNPLAAASGVATFGGCKIDKTGNNYTLTATATGLAAATSNSFNITTGTATKLAFTASPSGSTGGTVFGTQPVVAVQDAGGNTVTGDSSAVTLAIASGTTGATLSCAGTGTGGRTVAASSGVAAFSGCSIDKSGTYTLTSTDGSLTAATSGSFTVTVGPAVKLAFTTQPSSSSTSGAAFTAQPVVTVQDAGGNTVTGDTSSVTLALTGTGPSGAVLSCTTNPKAAVSGVATFSGCTVDKSGSGYTLTAADGSLGSATSTAFAITAGTATKLVFSTQPGNGTGGISLGTQPVVTVQDANGNTVTTDASSVTLAITGGTGTSGATLTCTANSQAASSGVATFTGCKIDKAGTNYTLTATDPNLTIAVSSAVTITVGPASQVVLTTQPAAGASLSAGSAFPVVATERDAGGNTVTSDSTTAVALTRATGTGTVSCPGAPTTLISGTASFSCSITLAGTGYSLRVTAGAFTATSNIFVIVAAAASKLSYTTQPAGTTAGSALATFQVAVQDTYGNTVTTGTGAGDTIGLTIGSGPGTFTAGPTISAVASAGVASFNSVTLNTAGAYTLASSDSSRTLTAATSSSFTVTAAAASKLGFVQGPTDAFAGTAMSPSVTVQVQDTYGNSTATGGVAVTLAPSTGAVDSGATATTSSAGLATLSAVTINNTATGVTLTASATGYTTSVASAAFNITVKVTSSANALSDTAIDPAGTNGSGVASVSYYYCVGVTGSCTSANWTPISTSTTATNGYPANWTNQPANGGYRLVVVAQDNAGNSSTVSAATPVTVIN